jgi:nickel transport protein
MFRLSPVLATLALVAAVWHPAAAMAHGVGSRELDPGAARAMVFLYADGEPMAFAQVQVTGPDGAVHQSARTDGRGGFAFLPSGRGVWRVAASDGQGHRAEREVTVAAPGLDTGQTAAGALPATDPGRVMAPGADTSATSGTEGLAAPGKPLPTTANAAAAGIGPTWREIVLGLSLLANLALAAACWRRWAASREG